MPCGKRRDCYLLHYVFSKQGELGCFEDPASQMSPTELAHVGPALTNDTGEIQ